MNEILAAYVCTACNVRGRGNEAEPGIVPCWCCGEPAVITAGAEAMHRIFANER